MSDLLGEVTRLAEKSAAADRPAIVDDADLVSYGDLSDAARPFASGLAAAGVGTGDVVLVQLPNWWEAIAVVLGAWARGAVACPVVSIYREHELDFIVAQIRPRLVVVPAEYRGCDHVTMLQNVGSRAGVDAMVVAVRSASPAPAGAVTFEAFGNGAPPVPAAPTDPDARAVVLYTSATTSDPKGAIHTSATLLYESRSISSLARLGAADAVYMPSPLTHITGLLYGEILPIDEAVPAVLSAHWDPAEALATIEQHGCTFSVGATPFLRGLTDAYQQRAPSQPSMCTSAGEQTSPRPSFAAHARRWEPVSCARMARLSCRQRW